MPVNEARCRGVAMDVADWLRSQGLERYEAAFRANAIDSSVLRNLTASDLRDIGVAAVGDRRRLLKAISALHAAAIQAPSAGSFSATEGASQATAERRQVTVMFADLVGSTALSTRMDPEDLREILAAYHRCATEIVHRFDEFAAQYLGDGVLAYFGYPQAHEDDPERAARTGLELVDALRALKARVPLQARVGIATGIVVVGDLFGSGGAHFHDIVGETPNLAARLQSMAEPNTVVIAESTRRLLGNLFELEDLGARELKGIEGPTHIWGVVRTSSAEGRFEAFHASRLTDLVGREEECDLLLRCWADTRSGDGRVVLLSGEAGIGKSRLTAELLQRLGDEQHVCLRYFCSPQHTDSALYPIIGQMERAAGLAHEDKPQTRLDKLDALLARNSTSPQDAALFAQLLSLENDGRYPVRDELSPERRRERTLDALSRRFQSLAGRDSVLIIFEDAHWADPTSLQVVGQVVGQSRTLRLLLIVTCRSEFKPPWIGQANVTALALHRLTEREIDAMIERIAGDRVLAPSIRADIVERTDGVPLFAEEMTKAVLEAGGEDAAELVAATIPPAVVPASLHASLTARLDRLGAAKEVAQVGAAIGREFSHGLLAAVTQKPERELRWALDRLVAAELLFQDGTPPHASYLFKHALVQDAAYSTLLRAPRRNLHARIAETLEQEFPERVAIQPELLARHLTEAGRVEPAISYWLRAGQRAAACSADEEAVHHLRRGLEMLASMPESTQKDRHELELQLALGTPLAARYGYGTPAVRAARDRAIALCERLDDTHRLLPCLFGQLAFCLASGMILKALEYAERCQFLAVRTGERLPRLMAHRAMGSVLLEMGQFEAARDRLEQFVTLHHAEQDRSLSAQFVTDPYASGLAFLALTLWALGFPDQATAMREKAFAYAADLNHANTNAFVSMHAGAQLSEVLGNTDDVRRHVDSLMNHSHERLPGWAPVVGHIMIGWAAGSAGELERGTALMKRGIEAAGTIGGIYWPHYYSLFAILQARLDVQASASAIRKAKDLIAETGEYLWHADVLRIEGELAPVLGKSEKEAEASFSDALEVARKQRAKSFELRAATSLANLWRTQGRRKDGYDLLAPVYSWFTEGFHTSDLTRASDLLEKLS